VAPRLVLLALDVEFEEEQARVFRVQGLAGGGLRPGRTLAGYEPPLVRSAF
jgi:hypothetical protein